MLSKRFLVNLAFALSFFPFIRVIPVDVAVQPVCAGIAALIIMLFGIKKDNITLSVLLLLTLLAGYWIVGLAKGIPVGETSFLLVGYSLPLLLFLALRENAHLFSERLFKVIVAIYLGVGLLQHFEFLVWSEPYLGVVFPNISSPPNAPRGVNFLATEPAHAGTIICLILVTGFYFHAIRKISTVGLAAIVALVMVMFALNKSGTGFLLIALFAASYLSILLFQSKKAMATVMLLLSIFLILSFSGALNYLIDEYSSEVKFLSIAGTIRDTDWGSLFSYQNAAVLAGKRMLTVLVGYAALIDGMGFGHGLASHLQDFMRISYSLGIDWTSFYFFSEEERYADTFKPDSYGASIAMDVGALGLLMVVAILVLAWRGRNNPVRSAVKIPDNWTCTRGASFIVASFMILIYTTTTLPVPWLMLAYVYALGQWQLVPVGANHAKDKHNGEI